MLNLNNNDITTLSNFSLLRRLATILLSNNRISYIDPSVGKYLPNLHTLILNNNDLSQLSELEGLKSFKKLEILSLVGNGVVMADGYRSYVLYICKNVRVLDFRKVTAKVIAFLW